MKMKYLYMNINIVLLGRGFLSGSLLRNCAQLAWQTEGGCFGFYRNIQISYFNYFLNFLLAFYGRLFDILLKTEKDYLTPPKLTIFFLCKNNK